MDDEPTPIGPPETPTRIRTKNVTRTLLLLTAVVIVIGGAFYWLDTRNRRTAEQKKEKARAHVLLRKTDEAQDWRMKEGARVEELSQTITQQKQDIRGLETQIQELRKELKQRDKEKERAPAVAPGPQTRKPTPPVPSLAEILPPPAAGPRPAPGTGAPQTEGPSAPWPGVPPRKPAAPAPEQPEEEEGAATVTVPPKSAAKPLAHPPAAAAPRAAPSAPGRLRVITQRAERGKPLETKTVGWLPSGSFIHAVLLSGVDAGTGTGSSLPYPVLMRLTDPGVLPNRFKMDLAECFVIGAAFGDLPSERVYIRTETLSCLRRSGAIITIDGDLKGHAIGEDGKLGLRGRIVSKEGTIIARSLLAGFLSGLGQAFRPRITYAPLVLGGQAGTQDFQLPPLGDTLQAAGVAGVGRSMEMLAQYYLRQAQNIYPVIEIDSGRTVDLVVLKGMPLKFNVQRASVAGDARPEVVE